MNSLFRLFSLVLSILFVNAYTLKHFSHSRKGLQVFHARQSFRLKDVPLELTGQLDPSKVWPVKFIFKGEEKIINVSEGTSFLEASEKSFDDVESSCRNGVCTTCAGQVLEGRDNVKLAVHGLGKPQIEAGFICACQAYCTGPGIVVKLGMYDEVYETQYGQFERSYKKN